MNNRKSPLELYGGIYNNHMPEAAGGQYIYIGGAEVD